MQRRCYTKNYPVIVLIARVEDPSADRGKETKVDLTKSEPLFRAETHENTARLNCGKT